MNLKLIEAAATAYAKETWNHEEDQFMCIDGFKEGAKWAQEEFVKSLWHDASEKPMLNRLILALTEAHRVIFDFEFIKEDEWKELFQIYEIVRWAYLDNILPKEGGEE